MNYNIWQLIWFFFIYGFLGWLLLTAIFSLKAGHFVNKGFMTGPFCPTAGIAVTLCAWLVDDQTAGYLGQYLLCLFVCYVASRISNRATISMAGQSLHRSLLSEYDGFGRFSKPILYLSYGLVCFCAISLVQPLVVIVTLAIPELILLILCIALLIVFFADLIASGYLFRKLSRENLQQDTARDLSDVSNAWGSRFFAFLRRRIYRAYPEMEASASEDGGLGVPDQSRVFAPGVSLLKIFWIFMIGALIGDLVETFYCGLVDGQWMSRSSFLYGTLSVVWGGGCAIGILLLEPFAKKKPIWLFLGGFVLGGAYEYLCSVFTEVVFGKVFWDYSDYPLNIGGRTNAMFMFFWGIAAIVLLKFIYPLLDKYITAIPPLPGLLVTWVLVIFMVLDIAVTGLALGRYSQRAENPTPQNKVEEFLDVHYPNELIEARWPNMLSAK